MKSIKEILINIIKFIYNELPYSWVSFLLAPLGYFAAWLLISSFVDHYRMYAFDRIDVVWWGFSFFYTIFIFFIVLITCFVLFIENRFNLRIKNKFLRNSNFYRVLMLVLLTPFLAFLIILTIQCIALLIASIPNLFQSLIEVIINHEIYFGF